MDVDNSFQTSYSVSGHPSAISGLSLNKKVQKYVIDGVIAYRVQFNSIEVQNRCFTKFTDALVSLKCSLHS